MTHIATPAIQLFDPHPPQIQHDEAHDGHWQIVERVTGNVIAYVNGEENAKLVSALLNTSCDMIQQQLGPCVTFRQ